MLSFVKKDLFSLVWHTKMPSVFATGRSTNAMAWKLAKWAKFVLVLTNTKTLKKIKNLHEQNFEGFPQSQSSGSLVIRHQRRIYNIELWRKKWVLQVNLLNAYQGPSCQYGRLVGVNSSICPPWFLTTEGMRNIPIPSLLPFSVPQPTTIHETITASLSSSCFVYIWGAPTWRMPHVINFKVTPSIATTASKILILTRHLFYSLKQSSLL